MSERSFIYFILQKCNFDFRDEFLAVRADEGSFYLCKAMQNIYIGSRNITIQWFSNEEHIIPAKENPDQDIYAPDFYDKTGRYQTHTHAFTKY